MNFIQTSGGTKRGLRAMGRSDFVRHNAIFFGGAVAIGALNYIFYPIMARLLKPGSFGEVQALFSIFAQLTVFFNVLSLLTVNIVANYSDAAKRNQMIAELEKLAVLVSVAVVAAALVAGAALERFFHFGSSAPFVLLALTVLVTTPLTFRSGFLRGRKQFGLVALTGVVASACDLVFSIVLVLLGRGTSGAMLGLVLAQAAATILVMRVARRKGFAVPSHAGWRPNLKLILPELKYAGLVLAGSLAITALYSIDTITVKHYFDARTAGLYAGVSTIARIIFFLTASVAQVLLPSVRLHNAPRQNARVLQKSLGLLTLISGAALVAFALAPRLMMRTLMGKAYLPYAHLLPRLSTAMCLISMLNLFVLYHIALRRYMVMFVTLGGVFVTFGLLAMNHQTLQAVVNSVLFGSLSLAALLAVWSAARKQRTALITEGEMG